MATPRQGLEAVRAMTSRLFRAGSPPATSRSCNMERRRFQLQLSRRRSGAAQTSLLAARTLFFLGGDSGNECERLGVEHRCRQRPDYAQRFPRRIRRTRRRHDCHRHLPERVVHFSGHVDHRPVTEPDRDGATTLLFRSISGEVPEGTRSIIVEMDATRFEGAYDDGYADNLSLVVSGGVPAVPEPATITLLLTGLTGLGARKRLAMIKHAIFS